MENFYQILFLGNTNSNTCNKIKKRFYALLKERGLEKSIIVELNGTMFGYKINNPTFAFYFGKKDHDNKDIDALKKLIEKRNTVFPIFFSNFEQEIPEILHPINGIRYTDIQLDNIVNVAFEELRLLRKKRRVFISYKRSDSTAIANQLYDVLSRNQFDVFLDTYSIRGAADFQAELHHRITDSDILIQLNSPGFMDSVWCEEEINEANARQVGILQLNWPEVLQKSTTHLCTSIKLDEKDFKRKIYNKKNSTLKKSVLNKISAKVESLRARNIAAREVSLTAEFAKEAERQGRTILKEHIFLVEERKDGKKWYYIPAIGVPQSMDYYESTETIKQWISGNNLPDKVFLIYDDLRILPKWISHLDWMDNYLEVKSIKKQNFTTWIQSTM